MISKVRIFVAALALAGSVTQVCAQSGGKIVYSLPKTTLSLEVEAVCESFHAGPYAKYAKKYLGIDAREDDSNTYTVSRIKLTPRVEADMSTRYEINVGSSSVSESSLLKITSQGLISLNGSFSGGEETWRFGNGGVRTEFADGNRGSNFSSETVELYKLEKKDGGYERVAVSQTQVVAKSAERKAAETAAAIFNLREKREQIITGDTDATFSGEALGAAISEINRLEEQYMSLFVGYSDYSVQTMSFDLVPVPGDEQVYVAFRISEASGLLPSDNMSGRPVVASLTLDARDAEVVSSGGSSKGKHELYYRIPAVATLKIMDQSKLLMQARVPVYQLGETVSMPVSLLK